jgi:hypothetical protein
MLSPYRHADPTRHAELVSASNQKHPSVMQTQTVMLNSFQHLHLYNIWTVSASAKV